MTNILIKPHLTEKSMRTVGESGFTFQVLPSASKAQIRTAVESLFKVHVTRVNTRQVHVPGRTIPTRRIKTSDTLIKYATVTLKKGESIALFEFKES